MEDAATKKPQQQAPMKLTDLQGEIIAVQNKLVDSLQAYIELLIENSELKEKISKNGAEAKESKEVKQSYGEC